MAAKKGHHEVVAVLVAYNADTTIKDKVLYMCHPCCMKCTNMHWGDVHIARHFMIEWPTNFHYLCSIFSLPWMSLFSPLPVL